jgi:hypothetical protein
MSRAVKTLNRELLNRYIGTVLPRFTHLTIHDATMQRRNVFP